ncbi:hypothetical protein ILYODFUR_002355 [Ilyodon furcidens]|uniref:Uncharacterized protein n=1 Tax=Ilyodon furcidens TaxID=33524 RepID=A0ABV0SHT9_9TELE
MSRTEVQRSQTSVLVCQMSWSFELEHRTSKTQAFSFNKLRTQCLINDSIIRRCLFTASFFLDFIFSIPFTISVYFYHCYHSNKREASPLKGHMPLEPRLSSCSEERRMMMKRRKRKELRDPEKRDG